MPPLCASSVGTPKNVNNGLIQMHCQGYDDENYRNGMVSAEE